MSFYDNRYYHLNKVTQRIIGQWPFQSRLEGNVMFSIMVLSVSILIALQFWGLVAGIKDLNIIMENIPPLLINNFVIIKLTNSWCNKYKMKDLLRRIEKTWKIMHLGPENKILRFYAEESRNFTVRYMICLYSIWLICCVMPIVVNRIHLILPSNKTYSARFLYRVEHILDMDKYYNLLILNGFISIFCVVSVVIAVDCLFVLCTLHVCALFKCIKYNVERIQGSDFVILNPNIADDEAYRDVINCVKLYKHALKFSDLLSSAYATCFLFTLGNVVVNLSFEAAKLIIMESHLDEMIRVLAVNLGQLLHIYNLSMTSQRLIDHSSELQEVIYSCDWYRISLRSRHLLKFTLLRTTKPCQIEAGKMFIMSMENLSSILKVSVSYFTMITSIQ
ncbi:PREDICTED: odorant receptor 63a-like [Wasmannia auropunctata]|uniref:odorant receptor 63a-like n=1 Tax=Wasmannia auropunctata TaxID=64793 RepID=UPI0005EE2E3B|nr:PREDICTED: odorant receptor 63a-like [Wasmannia auropunctata]